MAKSQLPVNVYLSTDPEGNEVQEQLLPTPPIGTNVVYRQKNHHDLQMAALVTAIEQPGRIKLTFFPPMREAMRMDGCWHRSCHIHDNNNPTTDRHGSWDYPDGTKIPNEHYEPHRQALEKRDIQRARGEEERIAKLKAYQQSQKAIQETDPLGV